MDNIQRYKYRTRRGSSALSSETFYTGAVRNERILQKKETYKSFTGGTLRRGLAGDPSGRRHQREQERPGRQ